MGCQTKLGLCGGTQKNRYGCYRTRVATYPTRVSQWATEAFKGVLCRCKCIPDWRAQLLLEQVREAEGEQALDRLRLLRGEGTQRQVYVLSNVPLNITVDCGWSWKQYQKSLEVLRTCSWIVPKKTKDLMALIPDISERTARDWLNELKTAESLIINTIRESADF